MNSSVPHTFEICIPILNEEKSLEKNILTIISYLESLNLGNIDFAICIADNGSSDSSPKIIDKLTANNKNVRSVRTPKPGVGLALKTAWGTSQADFIGYMDLDLATDLKHINDVCQKLISSHGSHLVVYGNRLGKHSLVKNRRLTREISSRVFNFLIRIIFSSNIEDGMCGFKFLPLKTYQGIISKTIGFDTWFFCTELLICAERNNIQLEPVDVVWTDDPNSKVKIIPLAITYLKNMFALKDYYVEKK